MSRVEQYEIWIQVAPEKWDLAAAFAELDVASAVANARTPPVRLVRAIYEDGRRLTEEVLAQIGARHGAS